MQNQGHQTGHKGLRDDPQPMEDEEMPRLTDGGLRYEESKQYQYVLYAKSLVLLQMNLSYHPAFESIILTILAIADNVSTFGFIAVEF